MDDLFPTKSLVTSKLINATPDLCRLAYMYALGKYYPSVMVPYVYGVQRFQKLACLLNEEKIRPDRYILHWFSVWNTHRYQSKASRYPSPKQLEDKALVLVYRQATGDDKLCT